MKRRIFIFCLVISNFCFSETLCIYSSRAEHLVKPLFNAYTQKTGVKIVYRTDKEAPLLQRLLTELTNPRADILLTVDAGNLWKAKQWGLLQKVDSPVLNKNIPAYLKDKLNYWFGFSVRARTIVYHPDRVSLEELSTYEDLSSKKWKNRLLLRTSKKVYNQSLVGMMISRLGKRKTKEVIRGWKKNFVLQPLSSDTKVLKAIAEGQADVGIVNTYYLARLIDKDPYFPVKLFWANQNSSGTHVNISGAGVIKSAKNKKQAIAFLEWLSEVEAQKILAYSNFEYAVNSEVSMDSTLLSFGYFKPDTTNIAKAGQYQIPAILLMDQVGYR